MQIGQFELRMRRGLIKKVQSILQLVQSAALYEVLSPGSVILLVSDLWWKLGRYEINEMPVLRRLDCSDKATLAAAWCTLMLTRAVTYRLLSASFARLCWPQQVFGTRLDFQKSFFMWLCVLQPPVFCCPSVFGVGCGS